MNIEIYRGNIVYSESQEKMAEHRKSFLIVRDGIVEDICPVLPEKYAECPVADFGDDVIIPAFSDLHVHAPQYPQRGLAMDALLNDWLNQYTFPLEAKYADPEFARQVYKAFVDDMIAHGTMHAVVFGTIHREATGLLLSDMEQHGLEAFVGKVNMDMQSPSFLCETTEESLKETEAFLEQYGGNCHARPILTPRFAPTCTMELLKGLGKLARKYEVGMQTHLVESRWEKAESMRLYGECGTDTGIYKEAGLLDNGPVAGAHFIFPDEEDIRILKECGGFAVQCPDATVNVIAGIMATNDLMQRGVRLGLGSDIASGHNLGIYSQISRSVQLSKLRGFYEQDENAAISFAQAFYMGTKGGGSLFGKVGSLEKGYAFDALVIGGVSDPFMELSPVQIVERFCYLGETGNIHARFLRGEKMT